MLALFEIATTGSVEAFVVSVPESLGLLALGIVLVTTVVLIRRIITKSEAVKSETKVVKKA